MSEETKKQPETEQEQAAAETKAPAAESDKQEAEPAAEKTEKKDWFGKKSKELEAVKAKLEAAEQANAKLKDQMLRTAAEYDNYKRSARRPEVQRWCFPRGQPDPGNSGYAGYRAMPMHR